MTNFSHRFAPAALLFASVACSKQTEPEAPAPEVEAPLEAPEPEDVHIEGDHLVIDDHINFAFDSDEILDSSSGLLDQIATLLQMHDEIISMEIIGHTDAAGGHEHNQDLSERRAAAVLVALQERSVPQELSSHGTGETEPLCEEDTDECHAKNRRVEFRIEITPEVEEAMGDEAAPAE